MVTGAKEQIQNHHDMVARGSEEFRNSHHMVTGQTAQTNQFPEFLTRRIQTPRNPQLPKIAVSQSTSIPQISHYTTLPTS